MPPAMGISQESGELLLAGCELPRSGIKIVTQRHDGLSNGAIRGNAEGKKAEQCFACSAHKDVLAMRKRC